MSKNPFEFGGIKPINPLNLYNQNKISKTKYERVSLSMSQKEDILDKQKHRCAKCHKKFGNGVYPHFDHKKPVSSGGTSASKNLQALCPNCHDNKTRKERVKKIEKRKRKPKQINNNPFSILDF